MKTFFVFFFVLSFAQAQTLLLVKKSGADCGIVSHDVQTKKEEMKLSVKGSCPENIILDRSSETFYYSQEGALFSSTKSKTEALGKVPGFFAQYWIENGIALAATLLEVPQDKVSSKKGVTTMEFEGKKYTSDSLPDWGIPYMAALYERKGKEWVRQEIAPTKAEAGDTPHLSVLKRFRERKVAGLDFRDQQMRGTCVGDLKCSVQDPLAKKILGSQEDYGLLTTGTGSKFYFAVMFGDTPHATTPLIFCEGSCEKPVTVDYHKDQMGLSLEGGFLLVGEEYSFGNPVLIDVKTGKISEKLENVSQAVWLR